MYSTGNSAQCYVAVRMGEEFDGEWTHESVQFTHSAMSDSLQPDELKHTSLPCPATTPRTCSNLGPSSWWCHPTISSSVIPFSSGLQSCPVSGSLLKSQFFASGGQSIGVSASASVLAMNFQDWFPLGWTSWISLQSKVLSAILQYKKKKYFSSATGIRSLRLAFTVHMIWSRQLFQFMGSSMTLGCLVISAYLRDICLLLPYSFHSFYAPCWTILSTQLPYFITLSGWPFSADLEVSSITICMACWVAHTSVGTQRQLVCVMSYPLWS